jgi:hypothetical protein
MALVEKMSAIQFEIKAPKSQENRFGNFKYRNCEDILEAAKPVCKKYGCYLNISDEIVEKGSRFYVLATASLISKEGVISSTAYAREDEAKKGMDVSQVTGAASSYARKYALNGLLAIDDTKDADTLNDSTKANESPIICKTCGNTLTDMKRKDGSIVPAKTVAEKCNGMCMKCWKAAQDATA